MAVRTLTMSRRRALAAGAGLLTALPTAASDELDAALRAFAGGAPVRAGKVRLDVAPLVENGNAVPITVSVDSPMTPDAYVRTIAVFAERNPRPEVATFHLGRHAGRATVATRIRLATSQKLVAVARLGDDSCWSHAVEVIVTLAACVES